MDLNRTLMLTIFTILSFFTAHCRHTSWKHRGTVIVERQLINPNSKNLKRRFEGDILVRKTSAGSQQSAVFQDRIWPDAKIPYQISNDYNQGEKSMILNAMNEIHAKTCVRFSPRTTERHFIDISKANSGCSSYVGRQGGSQELSLEDECFKPRIVKHELMHAIGFYHEQSRTDRDDYVVVHYDNVEFGLDGNFQKYDSTQVQSLRTPYDIKSIMHYGWNAFARDTSRPTLTAKNGGARIEPSNDFTETDILDINRLYNCNQGEGGNKGDWKEGKNGGFLWHDNCDFVAGNVRDIVVVDSNKDDCGIKCQERNGCTHFTWNGKCILKKAPASENFAHLNNAICGKLTKISVSGFTIEEGDTCYSTAKKCGINLASLYLFNPILNNGEKCNVLQIGWYLSCRAIGFTIEMGDTCYSTAKKCGINLRSLYAYNPVLDNGNKCDVLQIGWFLSCHPTK